jgi:hypothetical protein
MDAGNSSEEDISMEPGPSRRRDARAQGRSSSARGPRGFGGRDVGSQHRLAVNAVDVQFKRAQHVGSGKEAYSSFTAAGNGDSYCCDGVAHERALRLTSVAHRLQRLLSLLVRCRS